MIVDDEPLAVERLQMLCAREPRIALVGTATDGEAALRLIEGLKPDLVMLDIAMPLLDGIGVARAVGRMGLRPAVIFVTAFEGFAVEAFDLAAIDYMLKPVAHDRLTRAIDRVETALRHQSPDDAPALSSEPAPEWADEFWVPHRSELVRVPAADVERIDAERDYVRLHVRGQSYLLLQTITSLEERLDPERFIRIHRSCILRRDHVTGLRHEGLGVWSVETASGDALRIGRTYLPTVKKMAGR